MSIYEMIAKMTAGEIGGWALALLILILSLVQLSPLKINPWDSIFGWLGKKINGKLLKQIDTLDNRVNALWVNSHRQSILTFARECRNDVTHSHEEWAYILAIAESYESYCKTHEVSNGVVKEDTRYIRDLYQKLSKEGKL